MFNLINCYFAYTASDGTCKKNYYIIFFMLGIFIFLSNSNIEIVHIMYLFQKIHLKQQIIKQIFGYINHFMLLCGVTYSFGEYKVKH